MKDARRADGGNLDRVTQAIDAYRAACQAEQEAKRRAGMADGALRAATSISTAAERNRVDAGQALLRAAVAELGLTVPPL